MRCNDCRSKDIVYLEGQKTHRKEKWICIIIALLLFPFIGYINEKTAYILAVLYLIDFIVLFVYLIIDKANRYRTFTKCICNNCGKWWWL